MLTADLVRVRVRSGQIQPIRLHKKSMERWTEIASSYGELLSDGVGQSRAEIKEALSGVSVETFEQRVADGLRKLLLDRCDFQAPGEVDPPALRADLFGHAAKVRRELEPGARFERDAVLSAVAEQAGLSVAELEGGLYADLKEAQRLLAFEPVTAQRLLEIYDSSQEQAILLKATRVVIQAHFREPGAARLFFRQLKFRRLLFRLESIEGGGYRIEVDGPSSLFQSSTRYGLQLALMLPALREAANFSLEAEVIWGKPRKSLIFGLEGKARGAGPGTPVRLPDEVEQLVARFRKLDTPWKVRTATKVLHLPGLGLCVPDLVFTQPGEPRIYLEVMGYWSRDAVWKRVELVQGGMDARVIFALSSRLRVSEEVLGEEDASALYVYKGSMAARAVLEKVEALAAGAG